MTLRLLSYENCERKCFWLFSFPKCPPHLGWQLFCHLCFSLSLMCSFWLLLQTGCKGHYYYYFSSLSTTFFIYRSIYLPIYPYICFSIYFSQSLYISNFLLSSHKGRKERKEKQEEGKSLRTGELSGRTRCTHLALYYTCLGEILDATLTGFYIIS